MKFKLSKELLASLPQPDSDGTVRVQASIRVSGDETAELVQLNDHPVGKEKDDDADHSADLPDLDAAEASFHADAAPQMSQSPAY